MVADRDEAGRRKVRLMSAWVAVGIVLMVLGAFTTLWVSFLGAGVIGSTPVFFTLRSALASRQMPKRSADPLPDFLSRTSSRGQAARHRTPPRRRGHD
jgi:hypothetical protein